MSERPDDYSLAKTVAEIMPQSAAADALKVFERCVKEGKNPAILLDDKEWIVVHEFGREGS